MYIVLLSYKKSLDEVNAQLEAHRAYLRQYYEAGNFLASGPRNPRTGGVILVKAASFDALNGILAQDPFKIHAIADYEVIEFTATMAAEHLSALKMAD